MSRTQELNPRPLTPSAQEQLNSDLRRENEDRQEGHNRWLEDAEQQNQMVLHHHQQQQQVPGQGEEVEIVEEVVRAAPVNNGNGEAVVADEAGPEDAPAEETAHRNATRTPQERATMDRRNTGDRARYVRTGGRAKKQAAKEKVSEDLHSSRRTSRAGVPTEETPAETGRARQGPKKTPRTSSASSPGGPTAPARAPTTPRRTTASPGPRARPRTPTATAPATATSAPRRPRSPSTPRRPEDASRAGPSGTQPPVTPGTRGRMEKKRQRMIQENLDAHVLEEAATEAYLDMSMMEAEVLSREKMMYDNNRQNIRWQMQIDEARKKNALSVLAAKVDSTLTRLAYAQDSLNRMSAERIKVLEDEHSREQSLNERRLRHLDEEEEAKVDRHRQNRQDRRVLHAKNGKKAEDEVVAGIQASEAEENLSDEDEDDEDNDGDEQEDE